MSYTPTPDQDIRAVYNYGLELYEVQQERVRRANGATDPNDLGSILDLNLEGWETRYQTDNVQELFEELFNIAYMENTYIRSIDLGPTSIQSVEVVNARERLELLTF